VLAAHKAKREQSVSSEGAERIRLFVALELPDKVRRALGGWRSEAVRDISGLRAIPLDHLHVTLCFLGWRSATEIDPISSACAALPGASRPPEITLGAAIWLPPKRPRVLAVHLQNEDRHLASLQSQLSERLEAGGWYVPERRAYTAHVTVARVGRRVRLAPEPLPSPPALTFTGSRVTLFQSRLSAAGARYEALAGVSLG
jgi:2'-5' RNA ligase